MSDFTPDASQLLCLKTWYVPKNPLHLDPRHPCIKLAGEAGELLDLYGKHEYKPDFSWWRCVYCGATQERLKQVNEWYNTPNGKCCKSGPAPLVLDELGDYSYYLRILAYQKQVSFEALCRRVKDIQKYDDEILKLLSALLNDSSFILNDFPYSLSVDSLYFVTRTFLAILHKLDCPLEKLLDLNYQKLNTATMNGWKDAT